MNGNKANAGLRESRGLTEVYGLRDGRLLGIASRAYGQGVWEVYLANGTDENLFARGEFRRMQASTIDEVNRIFNREGLELRVTRPQNIPIPDVSIFDRDSSKMPSRVLSNPVVASRLVELMQAAADGRLPRTRTVRPKGLRRLGRFDSSIGAPMNKKQKAVLCVVAAAVVAMLIYPPFHAQLPAGVVQSLGYSLIFDPPTPGYPYKNVTGTVDSGLLITQWLGVLIVGGIAFLLFRD